MKVILDPTGRGRVEISVHRFEAILRSPQDSRNPWDRVIAESESFVAFPSLGSMVAGWLLIVPRRPVMSLRGLSASEMQELEKFSADMVKRVRAFPGEAYLFEHGNCTPGGLTGCGVDQAHLHIVPLEFDLIEAASEWIDSAVSWTEHLNADGFSAVIPAKGEYVSVWRPRDGRGLSGTMTEPRSQWIRRVIAEKLGRDEAWDYKAHPDVQNLLRTVEVMTTA